jgi:hypothetical protein
VSPSSRDDAGDTRPAAAPAGGKGRPTPKRREKEKRRGGPVGPPPLTRKEAAQRQKEKAKQARRQVRQGALAGEERYLPKRDVGPVRRLVRDVVDSRRNAGVLLLPIALFLVLAQFSRNRLLLDVALTLWLAGVFAVLVDALLLIGTLRRRIRRDFPDEERLRGHVGYGLLRSTVFRRWRMPAAVVRPGDTV